MKISIIIPTLNPNKHFLLETLDSIFSQSYQDFEVIVIDGSSKGMTTAILKSYAHKHFKQFYYIYRKPQGQSDAINAGMILATGDIIAYICADDTYEQDCFAVIASVFDSQPETQWVYGKGKIIDSANKEVRSFITKSKELLQLRYSYYTLQCVDYIVQPTVFMRREFYKQTGEFSTKLKYVMDYEYWLRAGKVSKPMFINWHLANWRAHSGSLSEKEHKAEAKQALEVQSWYSGWWFRPIQWLVYLVTITIYGDWARK